MHIFICIYKYIYIYIYIYILYILYTYASKMNLTKVKQNKIIQNFSVIKTQNQNFEAFHVFHVKLN